MRLRELHVELDYAVRDAYGWTDLELEHDHWETPPGMRFTVSPAAKDELLNRLLELNHAPYAAEVAAGLHDEKGKKAPAKRANAAVKHQGGCCDCAVVAGRAAGRVGATDPHGPAWPVEADKVLPGVRTPVREWYLVGMLAPKGTIVDPNRGDDDDLPGDDEGGAPGSDGQPAKVVLLPSSVGFTAAVDVLCTSMTVTASWGRYEKIPNPDPTATGAYGRLCGSVTQRVARWRCRWPRATSGRWCPIPFSQRWWSAAVAAARRTAGW